MRMCGYWQEYVLDLRVIYFDCVNVSLKKSMIIKEFYNSVLNGDKQGLNFYIERGQYSLEHM